MNLTSRFSAADSLRFFEHAATLFCVLGFDGQMLAANRAWQQLGLTWTEIRGGQWLDRVHPDDVPIVNDRIASISEAGGNSSWTIRLRRDDESYRWLSWHVNADLALRDISATVMDVTEEKRAYAELQQSEQRLARAIRGSSDGVWEWNILTDEVYLSPRYKALLGFAEHELANHKDSFFKRLHPDDMQKVWTLTEQHLQLGVPYEVEIRLLTKDDTYRWFLSRGLAERNAEGVAIRQSGCLSDITERKIAEQSKRESEQRLSFALEATDIGDWNMDMRNNVAVRSIQHDRCFGYETPVADWGYQTFLAHVIDEDRPAVDAVFQAAMSGKGDYDVEFRTIWPDQSIHWLWSKGRFYFEESGKPYRVAGIVMEISDKKLAEAEKKEKEGRYTLLFDNNLDGIIQTGVDGTILAANPAACEMLGIEATQLVNMKRQQFLLVNDAGRSGERRQVDDDPEPRSELTLRRHDGSTFDADVSYALYKDYFGTPVESYVFRDISERKLAEHEIHKLAFFDQLTGLGNRRVLVDRITQLRKQHAGGRSVHSIFYIDLDHFKNVNDARGHAVGDELLRMVAARIQSVLREHDIVARIGGDEFVVVGVDLANTVEEARSNAAFLAEKIRNALDKPFLTAGFSYRLSCSIGIALTQDDGSSPDDLLREADTAMYRAKSSGRNQVVFFQAEMHQAALDQLALESDLAHALSRHQLALYIQPQVNSAGVPVAAELLMRWTHPTRGNVPPALFIPVAEMSPIILPLGDWVLERGCQEIVRLAKMGMPLDLSLNISPRQFRQHDFASKVLATLEKTGAPATSLTLEVTEGVLIDDIETSIAMMNTLAAHGVRFSIDDFGTGYSSLSYVSRLPLHEIKIDRSFVKNVPDLPEANSLVQTIISMAKNLGLNVVAEGVETQRQANFLLACGCDFLQGYLYARPMPVDDWVNSRRSGNSSTA